MNVAVREFIRVFLVMARLLFDVLALVSFNVGIELAQLCFVALAIGPLLSAARHPAAYERWLVRGGSLVIAAMASFWVVERVLGG